MKFLIVTGMSGAGKSNAVKILEDMGFYCIDNMPPRLINRFIELSDMGTGEIEKAAFVIDIRGGEFFDDLTQSINELKSAGSKFQILFLEAGDEVLIRRYKETRRTHPMSGGEGIHAGIKRERQRLQDIRKMSDFIIDTSTMKPNQLRQAIQEIFDNEEKGKTNRLSITVMSFGYKYGIPLDADNVFDMRFIPNPFYLKSLKKLTGNNRKVRDYVMKWDETKLFIENANRLVTDLVPYYIKQGKSSLVISFGCTGGQHRSVAVANEFYELLKNQGYRVNIIHRDL
ncbi:MAG: RNase adapter RapZ [Bacillota bacterium]|nr:RNase adapter RapZ [Bacillota bacterium]